jgi:two-component system sensor histidine kinase PilS (NtrC family)
MPVSNPRVRPARLPARRRVGMPTARWLLQWQYVGRMLVAIVVFLAAALYFKAIPETILILAIAAIASVIVSGLSVWHTHVRGAEPGNTFLYAQALFDLALVTTVVHVTEGPDSQFPALYILVIAVSAVLMPFASSLLVTSLAVLLYLADIVWWHPVQLSVAVWLQIGVFVGVFIATGLIASRVRVVGAEREELRQEVRRLRLEASDILRNIRSGIVTVDDDGYVLYANPAAAELLGLARPIPLNASLADTVGDRASELLDTIARARAGGERVTRSEGWVRHPDRVFPIGVTATRIDLPEVAPSVTAIFTDISDQKRLEELHLRAGRLEAVAELSASLAHEIRNPLASIRSSVEQLGRAAGTTADERFLAELVVRESDRLSRLITEFLDFARVQVIDQRTVNLARVAAGGIQIVRNHPDCAQDVMIELVGAPAALEGDEDLLHRVVVNLVLNAVQASERGARVRVEVREATADELPPGLPRGSAVLLRVADQGPGIPPAVRSRLFQPFVSGRTGGSGLGLAIVDRAVQAHRGVVLVDSAPGRGTVFSVFLPTRATTEVAA